MNLGSENLRWILAENLPPEERSPSGQRGIGLQIMLHLNDLLRWRLHRSFVHARAFKSA
jgi:hypothetical protein